MQVLHIDANRNAGNISERVLIGMKCRCVPVLVVERLGILLILILALAFELYLYANAYHATFKYPATVASMLLHVFMFLFDCHMLTFHRYDAGRPQLAKLLLQAYRSLTSHSRVRSL